MDKRVLPIYGYLAGAIAGLDYSAANRWRETVVSQFPTTEYRFWNPLRGKDGLLGSNVIQNESLPDNPILTYQCIFIRDLSDIDSADFVIAYIQSTPSIGTLFELGYAYKSRIPVFLLADDTEIVQGHPFLSQCCVTFGSDIVSLSSAIRCYFNV